MDSKELAPNYSATWLVPLIVCPLLYLLSFGPAWGLEERGYVPTSVVYVVYYPVRALCRLSPTAKSAFRWYEGLFSQWP